MIQSPKAIRIECIHRTPSDLHVSAQIISIFNLVLQHFIFRFDFIDQLVKYRTEIRVETPDKSSTFTAHACTVQHRVDRHEIQCQLVSLIP